MNTNPLLVLSAAIVTAAAGSTASFEAPSPASTACSLVTRQEAAAAAGAVVPAGSERTSNVPMEGGSIKMQTCLYGSEVVIGRFELGSAAPALFSKYRQSLVSKSDYESIKGVGDEAFHAKGQLAVRKGQTGLIIDVGQARGGGAAELQKEKALALLAVGRI